MMHAIKRWAVGCGLVAAALATAAPPVAARAFTYSTKLQTIRVGVLLANRGAYSDNQFTPPGGTIQDLNHSFSYVFHALNARSDIRPYGWEILNPNAPPFMDEGMARRYGVSFDVNNPPRINKNMGVYWEVFLKASTTADLSKYDVLYMPYPLDDGVTNALTVEDREKLRRAVDGGTILWIDNVTGGVIPPVTGAKLFTTPGFNRISGGARQYGDPTESLMNTPYRISAAEARQIGSRSLRTRIAGATVDNRADVESSWKPVLLTGPSTVTAAVFNYGQGAIVLTGGAVGRKLSQGFTAVAGQDDVTSGTGWRANNTGPISGSNARLISTADLKFLVNIMAYRFQSPQPGGGPRHSSGSRQDLDTPLGKKWQHRVHPAFEPVSDPVVWNGVVFAVTSEQPGGFLRAYDMDPQRDLDGDGNPDDGIQDPPRRRADVLWEIPLGRTPVSSLVMGTYNGEPILYGMTARGEVFAVRALPYGNVNGRRRLLPNTTMRTLKVFDEYPEIYQLFDRRSGIKAVPDEGGIYRVPAPVWYNGRLFAVGVQENPAPNTGIGGIVEIDPNPARLSIRWSFPRDVVSGTAQIPPQSRMGIPSATPTVAAIPDKGPSDATDILLLVPTLSVNSGDKNSGGLSQASRVMAFPLGVRGERVSHPNRGDADTDLFLTRFSSATAIRVDDSSIRLWAPDGSVATGTAVIDRARGFPRLGFTTAILPNTDDIRADYDFLPGEPGDNFQGYNARWSFDAWSYVLGGTAQFLEILTTPVVSSDGGIYFVASDVGYGGNQPPVVMGLEMRQQSLAPTLENNPNYLAPLNQPQLTFLYSVGGQGGSATEAATPQAVVMGTPAVDRGILYTAWGQWPDGRTFSNGQTGDPVGRGGISGFQVANTRFGLLLQYPVDEKQRGAISIAQRNRYTGDFQQVGFGLFDIENVNTANGLRGLLVFRSLSAGSGSASLDLSRPYDIQVSYQAIDLTTGLSAGVSGETPAVYYRTASAEGESPDILRAFRDRLVPEGGGGVRTGVTVAGGSVYVGSDAGMIWAVPMPTELERLQNQPATLLRSATFPSLAAAGGPGSDLGYILRSSPVVADNTLVQNSTVGVFTFYSPRTLITEGDRVLEVVSTYRAAAVSGVESGSAAVWSMDSTTQTRDFGAPGAGPGHEPWGDGDLPAPIQTALRQPAMALRVNTTNTLVCDTGNNRVVEADRTGTVVWLCSVFADPYGLLGPNESRTLKNPTAVQRWESFDYEDDVPVRSVHTLITDSGNNRVLEIVTRYSGDPNKMANNVLVWVGRGPEGSSYQFLQAHRLPFFPANANHEHFGSLDYGRTVASVGNLMVNSADATVPDLPNAITNRPATSGGSVVLFGGRADGAASGRVVWFLNTMTYGTNPTVFPLARPVYFEATVDDVGPMDWRLLMTDGQNVFDLVPSAGTPGLGNIVVDLPNAMFPIVANQRLGVIRDGAVGTGGYTTGITMVRRLASGNLMFVNRQTNQIFEFATPVFASGSFSGPGDLLLFTAPPLEGTTALNRPVYADRVY